MGFQPSRKVKEVMSVMLKPARKPAMAPWSSAKIRVLPLRDVRLTRKVALAFGFMAFIPLLLVFWGFHASGLLGSVESSQPMFQVLILDIIGSIVVGYLILKSTMRAVMDVVHQARAVSQQFKDVVKAEPQVEQGDEIGELARTFNRITHELEHKIDELQSSQALIKRLLSRIGNVIGSYEGVDNLLELIVENASDALQAQLGSLMLVDGQKQEIEAKAVWSGATSVTMRSMKLGEGIAGWVAREGTPMHGTGSAAALGCVNGAFREGAVLCVPLTVRDKTLGVLSVFRSDLAQPFTEDDRVLLVNIGSQIAVALENYRLNLDIERTYLEAVMALALAVEAREPYTAGHSKRVAFYATQIAQAMGVDEKTMKVLKEGGVLHDVGKIGIKDHVLLKPAPLDPDEQKIMQQHSVIGEAILKPLRSLGSVAELVRSHHERYDGGGYPGKLKGEQIPLPARILVVADSYDAMTTDRPYRKRMTIQDAKAELKKGSGTQFDPQVVEIFLSIISEKEERLAAAKAAPSVPPPTAS